MNDWLRRWGFTVLIMAAIFGFSSIPGTDMPRFNIFDTLVKKGARGGASPFDAFGASPARGEFVRRRRRRRTAETSGQRRRGTANRRAVRRQ